MTVARWCALTRGSGMGDRFQSKVLDEGIQRGVAQTRQFGQGFDALHIRGFNLLSDTIAIKMGRLP